MDYRTGTKEFNSLIVPGVTVVASSAGGGAGRMGDVEIFKFWRATTAVGEEGRNKKDKTL